MAVTFQSVQTQVNSGNATTVVITKPTSLAVGDLMVAHLVATGGTSSVSSFDFTQLSGWTIVINGSDANHSLGGESRIGIQYKIADSGDAAASNFTFTFGASRRLAGAIYRITGTSTVTPVQTATSNAVNDASSPQAFSATAVTPSIANSLLLLLVSQGGNTPGTTDSYAIANNNPSWMEDYDTAISTTGEFAGAHATYAPTTITGNVTIGFTATNTGVSIFFLVIKPSVAITVTQVGVQLLVTGGTNAIKVGVRMFVTAAQIILTGGSNLIKRTLHITNQSKNSATNVTNQNKTDV